MCDVYLLGYVDAFPLANTASSSLKTLSYCDCTFPSSSLLFAVISGLWWQPYPTTIHSYPISSACWGPLMWHKHLSFWPDLSCCVRSSVYILSGLTIWLPQKALVSAFSSNVLFESISHHHHLFQSGKSEVSEAVVSYCITVIHTLPQGLACCSHHSRFYSDPVTYIVLLRKRIN